LRSVGVLSLLAIIILIIIMVPTGYSYTTKLNFSPPCKTPLAGQPFTVDVTVANVVNLNNWQIDLSFNPEILNCTGLSIPPDSIFDGNPYEFPAPIINDTTGKVMAFCGLGKAVVSGSGKLATISFRSRAIGISTLTFLYVMARIPYIGTYLSDNASSSIPFDPNVGIVEVIGSGFVKSVFNVQTHNVAIWTNSTVTNFYYDATLIEIGFNVAAASGTKGVFIAEIDKNLLNGTLITMLGDVGLSTYTRSLNTLPENATHCFTYFHFTYDTSTKNVKIRLTIKGDLNGDRIVDVTDVAMECAAYGTTPSSADWNPVCDVNHDTIIDVSDLAMVVACYGAWLRS
jgi:hypothetical protein